MGGCVCGGWWRGVAPKDTDCYPPPTQPPPPPPPQIVLSKIDNLLLLLQIRAFLSIACETMLFSTQQIGLIYMFLLLLLLFCTRNDANENTRTPRLGDFIRSYFISFLKCKHFLFAATASEDSEIE